MSPVAATVKETPVPAAAVTLLGWVVMVGPPEPTVRVTVLLLAVFPFLSVTMQ